MMWGTSVKGVMGFALLSHVLIERCHRRTMPSPGSRFMYADEVEYRVLLRVKPSFV